MFEERETFEKREIFGERGKRENEKIKTEMITHPAGLLKSVRSGGSWFRFCCIVFGRHCSFCN